MRGAPAESTAAETAGTDAQPAEETNADSFEADKEKGLALFRDEDYEGAYEVLAQYADSGDAEISGVIGYCYYGGWGVEQDDAKAAEYLSIAADADISEAQYMMGILYEYGYGVEQDDVKAAEYEAKAADAGYADAQLEWGISTHTATAWSRATTRRWNTTRWHPSKATRSQ